MFNDLFTFSFSRYSNVSSNIMGTEEKFKQEKKMVNLKLGCVIKIPRGVLRYISDGDVRSPFLGLTFAI